MHDPAPPADLSPTFRRTARRFAHGFASWLFGISISLMLVGLWGRAASVDEPTLTRVAGEAVESMAVSDRVVDWIIESVSSDVLPSEAEPVVRAVLADPGTVAVLHDVVHVLVSAALSDPGRSVVLDIRSAIEPHLEVVLATAGQFGTEPDSVMATLDALVPVVLDTGDATPLGRAIEATQGALRVAALVGAASAATTAALALALSEDRRRSARALAARTFYGAIGFAVMLRLGAWALDPGGGGVDATPSMRRAASILALSNLHIPIVVAACAAAVWVGLRRRRSVGLISLVEPATQRTGEMTLVPTPG